MDKCDMNQYKFFPCLFIGKKVICICYIDDFIFWVADEKYIKQLSHILKSEGFNLDEYSDSEWFLGFKMIRVN